MKTIYKMPKHTGTAFVRSVLVRLDKLVHCTEINMATYSVVRDTLSYIVTSTEEGFTMELVLCGDFCDLPVIKTAMTTEEYRSLMGDSSISYAAKVSQFHISDPLVVMSLMERLGH